MKVVSLPGSNLSPKTLLAQLLEDADKMEGIAVVIAWKADASGEDEDAGTMSAYWSDMTLPLLALAQKFFGFQIDQRFAERLNGE